MFMFTSVFVCAYGCLYVNLCVGPSVGREIVRDTGVHAYVIISSRLLYV